MTTAVTLTGKSPNTITDWYTICAERCMEPQFLIDNEEKWLKKLKDNPIQIDKARFTSRRKYNRGRMLNGDIAPLFEDIDAKQRNNRNYGGRIDRPMILKMMMRGVGTKLFQSHYDQFCQEVPRKDSDVLCRSLMIQEVFIAEINVLSLITCLFLFSSPKYC